MFYQEALTKFQFLSRVDSLLTIGDRHWRKVDATFQKPNQQIHFYLRCIFIWVLIFGWVVVVIKMGAYINGVLILCGCLLFRFYSMCERSCYKVCREPAWLHEHSIVVYVLKKTGADTQCVAFY